jgi:hypothetical protein
MVVASTFCREANGLSIEVLLAIGLLVSPRPTKGCLYKRVLITTYNDRSQGRDYECIKSDSL